MKREVNPMKAHLPLFLLAISLMRLTQDYFNLKSFSNPQAWANLTTSINFNPSFGIWMIIVTGIDSTFLLLSIFFLWYTPKKENS